MKGRPPISTGGRARRATLVAALLLTVLPPSPAPAKEIVKGASQRKSQNRLLIRADGLACYFCAYGLERYFKKSGKIAAFDMHMKTGVVEATLLRGEPLLSYDTVARYIHEAGFTFRAVRAALSGRLALEQGNPTFVVSETGERLPVRGNDILVKLRSDPSLLGSELEIVATGERTDEAPMALLIESAEPIDRHGAGGPGKDAP